ncbi:UNVERIFIED_CONTAM: rRNA methyltransferase 1, mitochondrial [Sesamum radiatum]|uniref:rRNA methyltransferase 1, mitochondrial n=1 Tax=Sesamum radiatum TaxID=300843 RepID=A0AAW2NRH8_SESRA
MAKPGALPLALRISSRPTKNGRQFNSPKPLSLPVGCHLVLWCNKYTPGGFQFSGARNCVKSCFLSYSLLVARSFSSSTSKKVDERSGKHLPWLAASTGRGQQRVGKNEISKGVKSSWEESAEKFLKGGASTVETRETRKFGSRGFENFVEAKPGSDSVEVRRWNKQESWGRKTWKEAKESTVPKIVGDGIYGVGPVLAALSAGRREFYALYVQEGLDLTVNNKKKKDKKGFEKVLKMAEKIGLSKKEVSKHDLNMVADNRPHQGLVLDASPLEMVGIKELEPVSVEGEKGPLWLALDEVTDPQNLGAIIRSAYFFGASGVVLCAKNSAPLSGVVSKASAGSLELMELRSCKNMMQFLASSAGNGWRVLGGSVSPRAIPLSEVVPGAPTILVLGSEGTGLRPLVERACTELIRIPGNFPVNFVMTGDEDVDTVENPGQEFRSFLAVESLNVSVAAGVLLNHLIGSNYSDSGRIEENQTGVIE